MGVLKSFVWLVEVGALITLRVFSLKIRVESSQIAMSPEWCSELRLTADVNVAHCHDEFLRALICCYYLSGATRVDIKCRFWDKWSLHRLNMGPVLGQVERG
ncbi:hypothetical protein TNCV_1897111 [Trichonephila clavipes]|nr:hypothetical protein TNCV_1897111 [Trichonephila clavipes]